MSNRGVFPQTLRGLSMKVTTHLHQVPRLRMSGGESPLLHMA
jgi:hypothetical protein